MIGKYYKSSFIQKEKQVIITHPKHLFCIDFNLIIIPEFQEEKWPEFSDEDIWITQNIKMI